MTKRVLTFFGLAAIPYVLAGCCCDFAGICGQACGSCGNACIGTIINVINDEPVPAAVSPVAAPEPSAQERDMSY